MNKIRTNWQLSGPHDLSARTVVGYDLRRSSSLIKLFLTSFNDSARYEEINERYRDKQSGINLFYEDPADAKLFKIPADARIIAFDLPTEYVIYLSKGNFSSPEPLPKRFVVADWSFVGFDVVDVLTQASAFHDFDLHDSDISNIASACGINLNKIGLIDNQESAIATAAYFDAHIPEHLPFMPCGVWLKKNE